MTITLQPASETVGLPLGTVDEFCRRYRLDRMEAERLRTLLGDDATQIELLRNAKRRPAFL